MDWTDQIAAAITGHAKVVIAILLLLSVGMGVGAAQVEQSSSLEVFQPDSTEGDKLDYIEEHYQSDQNRSVAQVIVRDENVLDRETHLDVLEYERRLLANETVNNTLVENGSTVAVANLVATTAIRVDRARELRNRRDELNRTAGRLRETLTELRADRNASVRGAFEQVNRSSAVNLTEADYQIFRRAARELRAADNRSVAEAAYRLGTQGVLTQEYETLRAEQEALRDGVAPTIAEQQEQLRSMNASEVDAVTERVLSEDSPAADRSLRLMPSEYEPGKSDANATILIVTHEAESSASPASAPARIIDAQDAMASIASQQVGPEYIVFGEGVVAEEIDTSMQDSLQLVAPLALLFVLFVLAIAYRDPLDVLLGLFGVVVVLVWTFGFMGWTGIAFKQVFIMIPVLLIGLSIDFGIHVVMRYREDRGVDGSAADRVPAMRNALGALGVALAMVTATTAFGFLSNITSPAPPIREVGVVSAVGILATLVVFGALVPALKIELDGLLAGWLGTGNRRAFGTGGGRLSRLLSVGQTIGTAAPYAVILIALGVSVAGAYGAANVDSSFATEDFLADDPPEWLDELPEPLAPGDYSAKSTIGLLDERFVRQDTSAQLLIEGDITQPGTLERVHDGQRLAANASMTAFGASEEAAITSPLTVMRSVAVQNETFNATFRGADTNGDGVPDRNLRAVYDTLFAVAPDRADDVIERSEDGTYRTLRMVVLVKGEAAGQDVIDQMDRVETTVSGDGLRATATGQVVMDKLTQDSLVVSVISSLAVTLIAIFLLLAGIYRLVEGSASLGVVTLVPVLLVVTWVGGTMYLLDIPINVATALIASLTIGLGVDHSLHLSERYAQELRRGRSVAESLQRTMTGTGGAIFGSAATTVGGFGMLLGALLPPLRQLGLISAISIGYSFLAAMIVLPSLLLLWTRFAAPADFSTSDELPGPASTRAPERGAPSIDETARPIEMNEPDDGLVQAQLGSRIDEQPPVRSLSQDHGCQGQYLDVRLELGRLHGRAVVREDPGGETITNLSVHPSSAVASRFTAEGTSFIALQMEDPSPVVLAYETTLPESASPGTEVVFEGTLLSTNGEVPITGDHAVTVVEDLFEGVLHNGTITAGDLRLANEQFDAGHLSERKLTSLYRAWLTRDSHLPEAD